MDASSNTATTPDDLECMLLDKNAEPRPLALSLLLHITNGFSPDLVIDRGTFGEVYKGILENGMVAVKSLLNPHLNSNEVAYLHEVECLLMVKHKNIVRFLGYCANTELNPRSYEGKLILAGTQQRLLYFEYVPNGSLCKYITDPSSGLPWNTRFEIIKGICQGLKHLHENFIVHRDLKPENILLDKKMVPKISDFGISRCFAEKQTHATTAIVGTRGYMPPEFTSGVITYKFDLYSLGVIIMEMLTGGKTFPPVEFVLQSWSNRLEKLQAHTELEQIDVCAQVGIECMDQDPKKRPDIKLIIHRLHATENTQVTACSRKLLEASPLVLLFPFKSNKLIPCLLRLTNDTEKNVAFRLRRKTWDGECYVRVPQYGVVPPGSVYTLVLLMEKQEELPEKKYATFILESSALGDEALHTSEGHSKFDTFFEEAEGTERVVEKMTIKAVSTLQGQMMSKAQVPPGIKISYVEELYQALHSLDTDPTKQWIITGEAQGRVCLWNYQTQRNVGSFKVSRKTVSSVKFITRTEWFVAGSEDGFICVYKYGTKMQKITRFQTGSAVTSLAVHPTQPYVLSSLAHGEMKLWDWDKGWKCIKTFELEHTTSARHVAFNPMDTNCFASASEDHTIKVWNLDSPKPIYTLGGHSEKVNCLYFFTHDDQQYLITGSDDQSAMIWDLQKKKRVCTLEAFLSPVTSVISHPYLPDLITVTKDGTVYLWTSTNYRLKGILNIPGRILPESEFHGSRKKDGRGPDMGLACLMGSRRIVIGQGKTIAVMDIDNVEYTKDPTDYSEQRLSADSGPGDTTHEGSSDLLHVHQIELRVPFEESNERILCRLYLTNNTDEHVAFWLTELPEPNLQRVYGRHFILDMPVYGTVPPRCSYTLGLTAAMPKEIEEETSFDMIVHSCILRDNYIHAFQDYFEWGHFVGEAQKLGNAVHEVAVKAVLDAPQGETTSEGMSTGLLIGLDEVCCSLDVHPTEPWIVVAEKTTNFGKWVSLWNSETKCKKDSFRVSDYAYTSARCSVVTFIARKEWIMAATSDGFIHVFNYKLKIQRITSFRAHDTSVKSLAVHPTKSYVLSMADDDNKIKLWDWNDGWEDFVIDFKGWECIRIFHGEHSSVVNQVTIDPKDTSNFASASDDNTIKLWNLESPSSNYTLLGHLDKVNSLNFFTCDAQQYLITGSHDLTAKIWNIQKRICVHTLEAFMSPVTCVFSHPSLPVLLCGTKSGDVYFYSSTDFRPKRVVSIGIGAVVGIACPVESNRVVIGHKYSVAITDMDSEE